MLKCVRSVELFLRCVYCLKVMCVHICKNSNGLNPDFEYNDLSSECLHTKCGVTDHGKQGEG